MVQVERLNIRKGHKMLQRACHHIFVVACSTVLAVIGIPCVGDHGIHDQSCTVNRSHGLLMSPHSS